MEAVGGGEGGRGGGGHLGEWCISGRALDLELPFKVQLARPHSPLPDQLPNRYVPSNSRADRAAVGRKLSSWPRPWSSSAAGGCLVVAAGVSLRRVVSDCADGADRLAQWDRSGSRWNPLAATCGIARGSGPN